MKYSRVFSQIIKDGVMQNGAYSFRTPKIVFKIGNIVLIEDLIISREKTVNYCHCFIMVMNRYLQVRNEFVFVPMQDLLEMMHNKVLGCVNGILIKRFIFFHIVLSGTRKTFERDYDNKLIFFCYSKRIK